MRDDVYMDYRNLLGMGKAKGTRYRCLSDKTQSCCLFLEDVCAWGVFLACEGRG